MKEYTEPSLWEEEIEVEDICSASLLGSTENGTEVGAGSFYGGNPS